MQNRESGVNRFEWLNLQGFVASTKGVEIIYPLGDEIQGANEPSPFARFSMRSRGALFERNATMCADFLTTLLAHATVRSSCREVNVLLTCVDTDNHVVEFALEGKHMSLDAIIKLEALLEAYSTVFGWTLTSRRQLSAPRILVSHTSLQS
jgi:hypothetical protein